jgi:hypothetical protein
MSTLNKAGYPKEFSTVYGFSLLLPAQLQVLRKEVAQSTIETTKKVAAELVGKKISVLVKAREIVESAYENFKTKVTQQYAKYSDKKYQSILKLCIEKQKSFFMGKLRKEVKTILNGHVCATPVTS